MNRDEVTRLLTHAFDPSPAPEPFRLCVTEGLDAGKVFELDGGEPSRILVGTAAACTVQLTDKTVSRRHVALDIVGKRARISDLGSTNGTQVNGLTITEAYLDGGEVVAVGATTFRLERADSAKKVKLPMQAGFGPVVGASTEMRRLYPLCERLSQSLVPLVIEGEAGTGKELMAEAIHLESQRSQGPFIVLDCSAVPPNMLEAELYGHTATAFINAPIARVGLFERARGGTLILNEIADMAPANQLKLVRVLERNEILPLGANHPVPIDVRVIATTRKDLDREVQVGRMSEELLQRLSVARLELPPLRQRRGDIALLVRHFCRELQGDEGSLSQELRRSWEDYQWPGNVRELRDTLARHLALGELANLGQSGGPAAMHAELMASDPPGDVFDRALTLPLGEARQMVVEEFERRYVEKMLASHGGNVTRAAESAGVARRYFQIMKARVAKKNATDE